jgi:hypothetical protein
MFSRRTTLKRGRKYALFLICGVTCVFAVSWFARRLFFAPSHLSSSLLGSSPAKCQEWEKAEANSQGIVWDLTYESVLKRNRFGPDSVIWKWIHTDGPRPPVNENAARWQGEAIVSSILIEGAGAEGSPGGAWYIRTTNHLYRWGFNKGKFERQQEELNALPEFDKAFDAVACWQQGVPVKSDTFLDGYWGFLSLFRDGKSRQMLLTFRDLLLVNPDIVNKEGDKISDDENNWGRLWKTLKQLHPPPQ